MNAKTSSGCLWVAKELLGIEKVHESALNEMHKILLNIFGFKSLKLKQNFKFSVKIQIFGNF